MIKSMTQNKKERLFQYFDRINNPRTCLNCGRELIEVKDPIAHKKTGHLFKCKCMPKNIRISIG